jgi:nucleoid-associated protein YgaU
MATDATWTCPVCSEALSEPAEQCFRCETPLAAWWPFEGTARAVDATRGENLALRQMALSQPRRPVAWVALAFVLGSAVTLLTARWMEAPPPVAAIAPASLVAAPSRATPAPSTRAAPATRTEPGAPRLVTYRVQRGDSLWRIAAALTGDGDRWRALFPSHDPSRPLRPGATLSIVLPPPAE